MLVRNGDARLPSFCEEKTHHLQHLFFPLSVDKSLFCPKSGHKMKLGLFESCFFANLAERGLPYLFLGFHMALGKIPVAPPMVKNEEFKPFLTLSKHDNACGDCLLHGWLHSLGFYHGFPKRSALQKTKHFLDWPCINNVLLFCPAASCLRNTKLEVRKFVDCVSV